MSRQASGVSGAGGGRAVAGQRGGGHCLMEDNGGRFLKRMTLACGPSEFLLHDYGKQDGTWRVVPNLPPRQLLQSPPFPASF